MDAHFAWQRRFSTPTDGAVDHSESEDSAHDEAWHDNYHAHADHYKELVSTVNAMKNEAGPSTLSMFEPPSSAPKGKGKVYHCYSHDGGASLDIQTRCDGAGYTYVALRLTGAPTDIDHQRFKQFEADLTLDLEAGVVAGFFTDPPLRDLRRIEISRGDRPRQVRPHAQKKGGEVDSGRG